MKKIQFYAANLISLDCEKTAMIYSSLFSLSIIFMKVNHAELLSESGFRIFIDSPSDHCKVSPGSITFSLPELRINELNLAPLQMESYHEKERYVSYLDEYSNRVWIFEKK